MKSHEQRTSLSRDSDSAQLRAWRSLAEAYRVVYSKVNSDLRRYGLTSPQYSVLRIVAKSETGSVTMSEIGRELLVTLADVTLIVDNLEKRSLLYRERGAADRRVVTIRLTKHGRTLWKKISGEHKLKVAEFMSGLSNKELEQLIVTSTKIKETVVEDKRSERSRNLATKTTDRTQRNS